MLYEFLRVFKRDGSAFTDLSIDNQNLSVNLDHIDNNQYWYVGQEVPFNNLYFWVHTGNSTAASLNIQYWDGTAWRTAVDVLDGTMDASKTLNKSGMIQWDLAKLYNWQAVLDPESTNAPTEMQGTVYAKELYWIRIQPSVSLHTGSKIKEITYAFTSGQELKNYDIEIDTYLTSFAADKADWIEQIITASKHVVLDLKRMGIIINRGQILRLDDVSIPATLQTLILIYMNLGPSYKERRDELVVKYKEALNLRYMSTDQNMDGRLEANEKSARIRTMVR